ncbi:hypothetical protein QAD02_007212 [Eretmocerus hayati]|uniref:Uncharacterized protein n=1 Tax=Eretmocerus hayati TaxID=131215 RepID=A0ACC2N7B9_9HYME|nr:hypothetical protein QAD02_007212 [Eretmocerus hayati]
MRSFLTIIAYICVTLIRESILIFSDSWDTKKHPYEKRDFGKWELQIPTNPDGSCPIQHLSEVKIIVVDKDGKTHERLSPWATYVCQRDDSSGDTTYKQRIWHPGSGRVR